MPDKATIEENQRRYNSSVADLAKEEAKGEAKEARKVAKAARDAKSSEDTTGKEA